MNYERISALSLIEKITMLSDDVLLVKEKLSSAVDDIHVGWQGTTANRFFVKTDEINSKMFRLSELMKELCITLKREDERLVRIGTDMDNTHDGVEENG